VFLWFVGPSVLIVWSVFRSPAADYRLVVLGSVLPLVELPFGGPRLLHSLSGAALVLAAVMLAARGRRTMQRRWLGIPIGLMLHLALDGAWVDTRAFWWPALGTAWSSADLPELGRGPLDVALEVAGAAACWWAYHRFRLIDPDRRAVFLTTGRVGRDIVP
jgi:hypothetical protein